MKKGHIYIALIVFISLISGTVFIWYHGKAHDHKKLFHRPFSAAAHHDFIDPMVDFILDRKILLVNLHDFRSKLQAAIHEQQLLDRSLAVSYVFEDLTTRRVIKINENQKYSPASLMKVPVMLTLLKQAEHRPEILNQGIIYNPSLIPVTQEPGLQKQAGVSYSVVELIRHSITWSDNAATYMLRQLATEDSIEAMERIAGIRIGDNKRFDADLVSAAQYAHLLEKTYFCELLNPEMSDMALNEMSQSTYQEGLRKMIPSEVRIAQKFGIRTVSDSTDRVHGQLHQFGIVYLPGKPFLMGVMTRGSNDKTRKKMIEILAIITWKEVNRQVMNAGILPATKNEYLTARKALSQHRNFH